MQAVDWRKLWLKIKKLPKTVKILFFCIFIFFIFHFCFPLRVEVPYSQVITAENGAVLNSFLSRDDKWRMKLETNEITADLANAFIHKEDRFFYWHFGVNPLAMLRALGNNIAKNKRTSGASTITMQVARLLTPKKRTYWHKIVEMFRATQLELMFSKSEILQIYLNLVPYGSNIEGVKAASLLYFGKLPKELSLAEITALTIIPNRPNSLALGKHNDKILKERNRWLTIFLEDNLFDKQKIADALVEPLEAHRRTAPSLAPHFANFMHQNAPLQDNIKTTIRADVQDKVNDISRVYMQKLNFFQIHNASVIVLDNETRQVLAYLGSANFADNEHAGQVDGARAYRSPGSALKPLLYALAFDNGKATPKTVLTDVAVDFDGYAPENFDEKFNGFVSAEQALAASLNVPAVKLLNEIKVLSMVEALQKADFKHISNNNQHLGLSLALGGCGVSLWEMAGLYCALANEGVYGELKFNAEQTKNLDKEQKDTLFSAEVAYMITDILTKVQRPELPSDYAHNPDLPQIAWKTGTSYGRRDAWSIGFNARYTIAVWVGNFSGEGAPTLTGASMATPLLFKLFNSIDYRSPAQWFKPPETLQFRLVCKESGLLPNEFCDNIVSDYFLPNISNAVLCQHLKYVFVSANEKFAYCTNCMPQTGYKRKTYPNLQPEMLSFYEENGIKYEKMPPHNPKCSRVFEGQAPKIVSLVDGREYLNDNDEAIELMLKAQVANEVKEIYWYINDKFFQKCSPSKTLFFKPKAHHIKISCSDDKGRNADINITVGK